MPCPRSRPRLGLVRQDHDARQGVRYHGRSSRNRPGHRPCAGKSRRDSGDGVSGWQGRRASRCRRPLPVIECGGLVGRGRCELPGRRGGSCVPARVRRGWLLGDVRWAGMVQQERLSVSQIEGGRRGGAVLCTRHALSVFLCTRSRSDTPAWNGRRDTRQPDLLRFFVSHSRFPHNLSTRLPASRSGQCMSWSTAPSPLPWRGRQ